MANYPSLNPVDFLILFLIGMMIGVILPLWPGIIVAVLGGLLYGPVKKLIWSKWSQLG